MAGRPFRKMIATAAIATIGSQAARATKESDSSIINFGRTPLGAALAVYVAAQLMPDAEDDRLALTNTVVLGVVNGVTTEAVSTPHESMTMKQVFVPTAVTTLVDYCLNR